MTTLRRCLLCLLPETVETIIIPASGPCNICVDTQQAKRGIDWQARYLKLDRLISEAAYEQQGKPYDCIVPFSGGKDSTFTLWYVKTQLHLRPLAVTFNHGFMRDNVKANRARTLERLGVEHLEFTPAWPVVRKLMLEALTARGDFCWHCHAGIFAYPMRVAVEKQIPYVIWGEPSAEYTQYYSYTDGPELVDETRFNRFTTLGLTARDMAARIDVAPSALACYEYPSLESLQALRMQSFCLGSYIPWDIPKQRDIIENELGWQGDEVEGLHPHYDYEKIECWMQGCRDYIKYLKRGYDRNDQMLALDLRNGRIDPALATAIELYPRIGRPATLDLLLQYLNISELEFNTIIARQMVPPHGPGNLEEPYQIAPLHDHATFTKELDT